MENKALSVTQLTKTIKSLLENNFRSIWVEGEISNFKQTAPGHLYFTLKDQQTQISVVMFRFNAQRYLKLGLEDGVKIKVFGDVSVYERAGNYQIIASKVEKLGAGDLALQFLKLKEDLHKKGWFNPESKKRLPFLPKKIGIVTSKTGAVIRDMLNIIYDRFPVADVVLFPVKVQGEGAASEIAEAIYYFNQKKVVDVIIMGRGGGSIEDLWAFNEVVVAKAIFESVIPIISAVGHEVDFSISDFVADVRAETPTAAAVLVVPILDDIKAMIKNSHHQLSSVTQNYFTRLRQTLINYQNHYLLKEPLNQLKQHYQRVDDVRVQLKTHMDHQFRAHKEKVNHLNELINTLSPYKVLDRGYTITRKITDKVTPTSAKDLQEGELMETIFADFSLESVIQEVRIEDKNK